MPGYDSPAAPARAPGTNSAFLDRLAIGASAACLVHCLFLPLLIAAVPATSRLFSIPEEYHLLAVAFAVPVSAWAMITGFRHHGLLLPAMLGLVGLLLLAAGALAAAQELLETALTIAGSMVLAFAHMRNWQLRSPARTRA